MPAGTFRHNPCTFTALYFPGDNAKIPNIPLADEMDQITYFSRPTCGLVWLFSGKSFLGDQTFFNGQPYWIQSAKLYFTFCFLCLYIEIYTGFEV